MEKEQVVELLKEVGEPVACQERQQTNDGFTEWYDAYAGADICGQGSKVCGGIEYQWRGLYTSDQVAAAVLKAIKQMGDQLAAAQEEIESNKAYFTTLLEEQRVQLAKAEQRVAEACIALIEDRLGELDGQDSEWAAGQVGAIGEISDGGWRKFVKEV